MDKLFFITMLFDFYSELLTEKQREIFELYHLKDFSLSEISEEYSISRQAVLDSVKRTEKILNNYEKKLNLISKHMSQKEKLATILEQLNAIENENIKPTLNNIKNQLTNLLN